MEFLREFGQGFAGILIESGAWLVAGFLLAGLVHAFVPMAWVRRHLGGRGAWPAFKAALLGIPLPLCSCAVIPAAAQLRRGGASKGASASFAISTPETGEESIALTWGLLGPFMALVRPVAALATAVAAGVLIDATDREAGDAPRRPQAEEPRGGEECCVESCAEAPKPRGAGSRLREAVRYGLIEMPEDLAPWLVVGLALSAAIGALVPPGWIESQVGTGLVPMLLMLVVSLPLYVCATASTPVAAVLIAKGLSPGAALVLLLAGPATNTATMAWVVKDLGWRALAIYVGVIGAAAVGAGMAVDALAPRSWVWATTGEAGAGHGQAAVAGGAILAAVLAVGLWRRAWRGVRG